MNHDVILEGYDGFSLELRAVQGKDLTLHQSLSVIVIYTIGLISAATTSQPAVAQSAGHTSYASFTPAKDSPPSPLVDAPSATLRATSSAIPVRGLSAASPNTPEERHEDKLRSEAERNDECERGQLRGKQCRVSWPRVLSSSLIFLAAQHGGNLWMDRDTRLQVTSGDFWGKYVYCVSHYRWSRWKDDDPFGVDYIGHPMMGALTNSIYEQNDPKQRALTFENTRPYWIGRLRATAYSAAYSAQWKVGPASEASIGNTGITYYVRARDHVYTNETGMQDWFVTPIGGLLWNVGEDVIDRFIFSHVRHAHPRNRSLLFVASLMTPNRSAANVARFRAPYYRDRDRRGIDPSAY